MGERLKLVAPEVRTMYMLGLSSPIVMESSEEKMMFSMLLGTSRHKNQGY